MLSAPFLTTAETNILVLLSALVESYGVSRMRDLKDVIYNFSKIVCVLHSTSCLTRELWATRFIWHPDIRVTHYQSSAMTFDFTQYFFCNSFKHGLLKICNRFKYSYQDSAKCIERIYHCLTFMIRLVKIICSFGKIEFLCVIKSAKTARNKYNMAKEANILNYYQCKKLNKGISSTNYI